MCPTDFSVRLTYWLIHFQLKPRKLMIVPQEPYLHTFIANYISISIKLRDQFQQWKHHYLKYHLANASDRFFRCLWLPRLIYSHFQINFAKKALIWFLISLERKILSHREFVKKLKNLSNAYPTEKNNLKGTLTQYISTKKVGSLQGKLLKITSV